MGILNWFRGIGISVVYNIELKNAYLTQLEMGDTIQGVSRSIPLVRMNQVHGVRCAWIESPPLQDETVLEGVDAMVCTVPDCIIAVRTADCLPVMVTHEHMIAGIHAGRRGLEDGIIAGVLQEMVDRVGSTDGFGVWVGPAICVSCYQIDRELDRHMDLALGAVNQIASVLPLGRVQLMLSGECTCCTNRYYSYRRDGTKERIYTMGYFSHRNHGDIRSQTPNNVLAAPLNPEDRM